MQEPDILQKRNILIAVTFVLTVSIHIITIVSDLFYYSKYNLIYCVVIIIIILIMYKLSIHPKVFQATLIINWHFLVILMNLQSSNYITIYVFIYMIALLALYRSMRINVLNILAVLVEIFIVYRLSPIPFKPIEQSGNYYLFFLLIVCIISLLQTFYVKLIWNKVEKATLDREYNLTSEEAYLRLFFEQAEDAIAVFDLENRVIAVNPAFEKLYGWTKEEALGHSLPLIPPENMDSAIERTENLKKGHSYHLFETHDMRKDGTLFHAQISLSPLWNPHGEMIGVSAISRDISYIKENESLILQSEKLKLVGELAAGVAHEIRNPMTVISGFVQMMNEDPNSPYYEYTKLIQKETERIDLILSEFLVLSRPQLKQLVPISLGETITEIVQFFQFELQQKSIELEVVNTIQKLFIIGNENQIKQVFINLIKNAIEAIGEDGTITINMKLSSDEKEIFIAIEDNGCGIPPNVLERVFEPFYTTKTKGAGLGMMIIKKIIVDHNGKITITSIEEIGTEVLISFPVENN
ncbi:MAG: ATP-binding protein [Solibacillus sp.]|uniref:two-component system sensor histidine kinase NtrB n=1 Tax=Solibacillus sp. TaxID=1909654 RepID=UPI00331563A3